MDIKYKIVPQVTTGVIKVFLNLHRYHKNHQNNENKHLR